MPPMIVPLSSSCTRWYINRNAEMQTGWNVVKHTCSTCMRVYTHHIYSQTHTHTYSPGRGSLCVEPRGRESVHSQPADSAFENLRMRGKRARERGWRGGQMRKRWGWKEMQRVAINTGVFLALQGVNYQNIGRKWPSRIKWPKRPTFISVTPPHLSWERERELRIELRPNSGWNRSRRKYGQYADSFKWDRRPERETEKRGSQCEVKSERSECLLNRSKKYIYMIYMSHQRPPDMMVSLSFPHFLVCPYCIFHPARQFCPYFVQ